MGSFDKFSLTKFNMC